MTLKRACRLFGRDRVRVAWEVARFLLTSIAGAGFLAIIMYVAYCVLEYAKQKGY